MKPENLRELDSDELIIPYGKNGKLTAKDSVRRYRDVLKDLSVCNEDGREEHFVLGIEAQNKTHYAMPVRNGLYDFIQYSEQVKDAALLLNACAHLNIQINESEEETNMCEAWDEMAKDCRAEGKAEGIQEGLTRGKLQNLYELVWEDLLALNVAAKKAQLSEEEFKSGMDAYFAQLDYV